MKQTYHDSHRRRDSSAIRLPSIDERRESLVTERLYPIKLRRRRAQASRSFYDNHEEDEDEPIVSKWTIVRQRLPDILALSQTYKPTSIRAQLVLLVSLMNRQTTNHLTQSQQIYYPMSNKTISKIIPNNVIIDISGRSRSIRMKSIPPDQVIYVDVDNLSFAIPTRQLIFAISRGNIHETWKYCPPAISEMLIDISKAKVYDDRRQYERAQFQMRIGQALFLFGFLFVIVMVIILIVGATASLGKISSSNHTNPHSSVHNWTFEKNLNHFW